MKEIGGYIEFESYHGTLYHEGAVKLNCFAVEEKFFREETQLRQELSCIPY